MEEVPPKRRIKTSEATSGYPWPNESEDVPDSFYQNKALVERTSDVT
jgi:hypothetical protein